MKKILTLSTFAAFIIFIASCRKSDDVTPVTETGKAYMEFFNVVGSSSLNLNNQWYQNANGDSFRVTKLNYYISNIRFNNTSGAGYTEANSYHLIEHSTSSQMAFNLADVPVGKYTSVTFMIGVDSIRNVSGAQTGALDQALGNFWTWKSGYIMLKFEGISPQSANTDGTLLMHCGGFSGAENVLKTVTINFPSAIEVTTSQTPHIHLQADLLQMFKSPNVIDFSKISTIHMPGADAKKLSDNYQSMFSCTYAGL